MLKWSLEKERAGGKNEKAILYEINFSISFIIPLLLLKGKIFLHCINMLEGLHCITDILGTVDLGVSLLMLEYKLFANIWNLFKLGKD